MPAKLPMLQLSSTRVLQDFVLSKANNKLKIQIKDKILEAKSKNLDSKFFSKGLIRGKSFLDIEADNGFYSLLAIAGGASKATALFSSGSNTIGIKKLLHHGFVNNLSVRSTDFYAFNETHDVVMVPSLVDLLVISFFTKKNLIHVLHHLRNLARHALIIDWQEPRSLSQGDLEKLSKHGVSQKDILTDESILARSLSILFDKLQCLGSYCSGRKIYIASDSSFYMDENWCDLIHPKKYMVASKYLDDDVTGKPQFSRVYSLPDVIIKQASHTVALNEYNALSILDHPSIPKVLNFTCDGDVCTLNIQKMPGLPLDIWLKTLEGRPHGDILYIAKCLLGIIKYIASNGIIHRDISFGNMMWCEVSRKVSLIDFGWSIDQKGRFAQIFTPKGLGKSKKFVSRLDNIHDCSDHFAAASLLSLLPRSAELDQVISEMLSEGIRYNPSLAADYLGEIQKVLVQRHLYAK